MLCFWKGLILFFFLKYFYVSVLKRRAKRKPQTVTSLVNMLIKLYESQENQIKGAFRGNGRFILTKNMEKTFLKGASWDNMKPEKQEKLLQRFLSGPPPKDKTVVSKDEELELKSQRRTAKKPGVYSPAQYLQVLWQYSPSIVVILTSIELILEKCVPLQL